MNYVYMLTAVISAAVIFLLSYLNTTMDEPGPFLNDNLLNFFDAAGLGIFSVIGVQHTINAGFGDNVFFCVFLGMLTGVGGGMLRDIMSQTTPAVLRKHIYALASIAGALCYYYLHPYHDGMAILVTTVFTHISLLDSYCGKAVFECIFAEISVAACNSILIAGELGLAERNVLSLRMSLNTNHRGNILCSVRNTNIASCIITGLTLERETMLSKVLIFLCFFNLKIIIALYHILKTENIAELFSCGFLPLFDRNASIVSHLRDKVFIQIH